MKNFSKILFAITFICMGIYCVNAQNIYNLTVNSNPIVGGAITPSGTSQWPASKVVSVTATALPGYVFTGWTGSVTSSSNSLSITMDANKSLIANFARVYTLTLITNPSNSGYIVGAGSGINMGGSYSVYAIPQQGYRFVGWITDSVNTPNNPLNFALFFDRTIIANFELNP